MSEKFICEICGGQFDSGSEEEARKELEKNFPGHRPETCGVVCDDCYEKVVKDFPVLAWRFAEKTAKEVIAKVLCEIEQGKK